jgi:hypothetical protein
MSPFTIPSSSNGLPLRTALYRDARVLGTGSSPLAVREAQTVSLFPWPLRSAVLSSGALPLLTQASVGWQLGWRCGNWHAETACWSGSRAGIPCRWTPYNRPSRKETCDAEIP